MSPKINLLDGPRYIKPINDTGGLYMQLLRPSDVSIKELHPELKRLAAKHGFKAEGRARIGPPCSHGIDTVTHAVWFYDREGN
jgi:hypothetical protein